ncbi:MAG: acid phosphatase AphA [Gammaproteobacteria bacterium]|nr:acid phosphatase AphA [Gammaproteobacteria bacterium]
MPRRFISGLILGAAIAFSSAYYFLESKVVIVHPKIKVANYVKWTTIDEIEKSLKNTPPMNVGFDIDDTILFPRVSFEIYFERYCPHDHQAYRPSCTNNQVFWDHINRSGNLSPPKNVGKELIEMHKQRGDNIFFITAREQSKHKPETMTETLSKIFEIKEINKVIYLGLKALNPEKPGKTKAIIKNNIKIFYGDSDGDIAAAKAANIRGIRVMRSPNSQDNEHMPINGRYGEEVIVGSDV